MCDHNTIVGTQVHQPVKEISTMGGGMSGNCLECSRVIQ